MLASRDTGWRRIFEFAYTRIGIDPRPIVTDDIATPVFQALSGGASHDEIGSGHALPPGQVAHPDLIRSRISRGHAAQTECAAEHPGGQRL